MKKAAKQFQAKELLRTKAFDCDAARALLQEDKLYTKEEAQKLLTAYRKKKEA